MTFFLQCGQDNTLQQIGNHEHEHIVYRICLGSSQGLCLRYGIMMSADDTPCATGFLEFYAAGSDSAAFAKDLGEEIKSTMYDRLYRSIGAVLLFKHENIEKVKPTIIDCLTELADHIPEGEVTDSSALSPLYISMGDSEYHSIRKPDSALFEGSMLMGALLGQSVVATALGFRDDVRTFNIRPMFEGETPPDAFAAEKRDQISFDAWCNQDITKSVVGVIQKCFYEIESSPVEPWSKRVRL